DSDLLGLPPAEARLKVARSAAMVDGPEPPPGVEARAHPLRGAAGGLEARVYEPAGLGRPSPGLVFVHGGGFVTCDLDTHDSFCRRLAALGRLRVVSVAYRLAPEHAFPAAVDDAVEAFRAVREGAGALGIDPERLGIGGDSAGGNLSAVVALRLRGEPARPALAVLIYPAVDATCSMGSHVTMGGRYYLTRPMLDWYYGNYLGTDAALREHPDASPLLADDVRGHAPALVYTAHFDPLRDEGVAYAERLRSSGVAARHRSFDTMLHGFLMMGGVSPAALEATEAVAREVGEALRGGV
ncbi:MAG TPA: alpha/beta hydrolase, partial [Polyangiaceae bacterium]|nr:alpha/beta hydrolase [Polyangiaceae bacterium]